jgi:hypothetical protein
MTDGKELGRLLRESDKLGCTPIWKLLLREKVWPSMMVVKKPKPPTA